MKKIFIILLALILVFGIAACSTLDDTDLEGEVCSVEDDLDDCLDGDEYYEDEEYIEEDDTAYPVEEDDQQENTQPSSGNCQTGEIFDSGTQTCVLVCESVDDCKAVADDLIGDLSAYFTGKEFTEEDYESEDEGEEEEITLVAYSVEGQSILDPVFEDAPEQYADIQNDSNLHEDVWLYLNHMFPVEYMNYVGEFTIFTDGVYNTLAMVEPLTDDLNSWIYYVDLMDMENTEEFSYTLVHEFAHIITLNGSQLEPDAAVLNDQEDAEAYQAAIDACDYWFTGEGCPNGDSYLALFMEEFWGDIYDQWLEIDNIEDEDERLEGFDSLYEQYADDFVTDYAATSPAEDIAETFAYFVFQPEPAGDTIAEQKILFFYQFPELVQLRTMILNGTLNFLSSK